MKFKVGDVCIILRSVWPECPVGAEVTIIDIVDDVVPYVIDRKVSSPFFTDCNLQACDLDLKLKRDPDHPDELGDWDQTPWAEKIKAPKMPVKAADILELIKHVHGVIT